MNIQNDVLSKLNGLKDSSLKSVCLIENALKEFPQLELRVEHHFSLGIYARTLYIPKDTILTGHIHKFSNLNFLVKGKINVLIDNELKLIEAPYTVVSPAGTKRIARALEDSIWITVHGTHETNIDLIESHFIAKSEQEYLDFVSEQKQLDFGK